MKLEQIAEAMKTLPDKLSDQLEARAGAEREAGGSIDIDPVLPSVHIKMSSGNEYDFQEFEADELLATVPENIDPSDYLLAVAQNW